MLSTSCGRCTVSFHTLESLGDLVLMYVGADQEIPKLQRQGAIIILGMLGLARREVVTERVEALLKIGLGPLGMVLRCRFKSNQTDDLPGRFGARQVYLHRAATVGWERQEGQR